MREGLDGCRRSRARRGQHQFYVLAGEVGTLLGLRQREASPHDVTGQREPGVLEAGLPDVLRLPSVSKPGSSGTGRRLPRRQATATTGRAGSGPACRLDRVSVLDALGVVPHAVGVDDVRAGRLEVSPTSARRRPRAHRTAVRARALGGRRRAPRPGPTAGSASNAVHCVNGSDGIVEVHPHHPGPQLEWPHASGHDVTP